MTRNGATAKGGAVHCALNPKIAVDGKSVEVQVYEDGAGGWLLEIVDELVLAKT